MLEKFQSAVCLKFSLSRYCTLSVLKELYSSLDHCIVFSAYLIGFHGFKNMLQNRILICCIMGSECTPTGSLPEKIWSDIICDVTHIM